MTLDLYLDDGSVIHVYKNADSTLKSIFYGREDFIVYEMRDGIRCYVNRKRIVRIEEAMQ